MILNDSKPRPVPQSKPREKLHPREIYVSGGGLLVAPINATHLLCNGSGTEAIQGEYRHVPAWSAFMFSSVVNAKIAKKCFEP